jgi:hypothetical protein
VDLFAVERSAVQTQILRRNLTGSFVISAAALVIAIGGYFLFSRQVAMVQDRAQAKRTRATQLLTQAEAATTQHQARENQIKTLSSDAVPATAIMDLVADSLAPGSGISNFSISTDLRFTLAAEAQDEASMLNTVTRLQQIPILQNVGLQTFAARAEGQKGVNFTVTGKVLPLAQVHVILPGQPTGAQPGGAQ